MRIQVAQQPTQCHITLRHDHPELSQQAAYAVADSQRLDLVAFAHPMPGQPHLLIDRLDRHKTHVPLTRRRGDRFGIGLVVLGPPPFAKRCDELGRHDFGAQAIFATASGPMMRTAACLHCQRRVGRQLSQPVRERVPLQFLSSQHTTGAINFTR